MTRATAAAQRPVSTSAASAAAAGPSVNAAVIRRWANPSVLQKQFILTEIFQPPLAMREGGPASR
jgi:hypothetical protein